MHILISKSNAWNKVWLEQWGEYCIAKITAAYGDVVIYSIPDKIMLEVTRNKFRQPQITLDNGEFVITIGED